MIYTLIFVASIVTVFSAINDPCDTYENTENPALGYKEYFESVQKTVKQSGRDTIITVCQLTKCSKQIDTDTSLPYGIVTAESPITETTYASETAINSFCDISCEFVKWITYTECKCPTCPVETPPCVDQECPDGSASTGTYNTVTAICDYTECPNPPTTTSSAVFCATDTYTCMDNTQLQTRDPNMECKFPCPDNTDCSTLVCCDGMPYGKECEAQIMCDLTVNQITTIPANCPTDDTMSCPNDGTTSVPDISRNECCEFNMDDCCKIECADIVYEGYYDVTGSCAYKDQDIPKCGTDTTPVPVGCTDDAYLCLDDVTTLSTRLAPDCNFPCPDTGCDTPVCCGTIEMTDCQAQTECQYDITRKDATECGKCDCSATTDPPVGCTEDAAICSDETVLATRLPERDCDFECPDDGCNSEVCCDEAGDMTDVDVSLTVMTECEAINECSGTFELKACDDNVKTCSDGTELARDACCQFPDCPTCNNDIKVCCVTNGNMDVLNECDVDECNGEVEMMDCTADAQLCPGTDVYVGRNVCCEFEPCAANASVMKIFVAISFAIGLYVWM